MKTLIATLMIFSTMSAFAGWVPVHGEEARDIRAAAAEGILASQMKCRMTYQSSGTVAKLTLEQLAIFIGSRPEVYVNDEDSQPIVAFSMGGTENLTTVTASEDGRSVVAVESKHYEFKTTRVNVGTIRHPRFEDRVEKIPYLFTVCK